jgi:two-component system NtrC family sensor kinase
VRIACRHDDEYFEICFTDNGSGISQENLQRIFEPFYTTKANGTGLGLAVTRKIIEGHGGTLEISSETCSGTTVAVRLPLQECAP